MTCFYARVSTKEQNLDRQLDAAKQYKNIDCVFADKQSGKNFDRPEYQRMKDTVKCGDEVIVKELDRLGRNKELVKAEIAWFHENGIVLRILEIPTTLIDFNGQAWIGDLINNILIELIAAIAQQEREKMLERQREGLAAMRIVNGRHISSKTGEPLGRKRKDTAEFIRYLERQRNGEMTVDECCEALGIGRRTWYNRIKEIA